MLNRGTIYWRKNHVSTRILSQFHPCFLEQCYNLEMYSAFVVSSFSPDGLTPPKSTSFNISDIYVAPEILKEASYGTPADMWAFGVTLYQCLTGQLPFQIGTTLTMEVIEEICSGSFIKRASVITCTLLPQIFLLYVVYLVLRLSSEMFPENVSFNALLFLEKLLRVDPNERMNV